MGERIGVVELVAVAVHLVDRQLERASAHRGKHPAAHGVIALDLGRRQMDGLTKIDRQLIDAGQPLGIPRLILFQHIAEVAHAHQTSSHCCACQHQCQHNRAHQRK